MNTETSIVSATNRRLLEKGCYDTVSWGATHDKKGPQLRNERVAAGIDDS